VIELRPADSATRTEIAKIEKALAPPADDRSFSPAGPVEVPDLRGFSDELKLAAAVRSNPSKANRDTLAKVRFEHSLLIAEESEKNLDEDTLATAIQYAESAAMLAPENAAYWLMVGRL
jgi:hypothetical protein